MKSFFVKVKFFKFRPKTMDYNKAFWPNLRSFFVVINFYSQMEGAMKLKLGPICSS